MRCQQWKDNNWVLNGGQEPKSMNDLWGILHTKYDVVLDDDGVRHFSCTHYILYTLLYTANNSWIHKGMNDTVSTYYIVLEGSQHKHISHSVLQKCNLVDIGLKNCMILNSIFSNIPFWNINTK